MIRQWFSLKYTLILMTLTVFLTFGYIYRTSKQPQLSPFTSQRRWQGHGATLNTRVTNQADFQKSVQLCIEDNICKKKESDLFYIYKRKSDFMKRVESLVDLKRNITHSEYVVPNLVHFVQYTEKDVNVFEYHHMISVMAAYKIQQPDKIYFWLDKEPVSKYWRRIRNEIKNLYLIYRERPYYIRGQAIHHITKVGDVIRMEAIMEYGGMYFDLDVIVVKPLTIFRKYEMTMGAEADGQFCNAVLIGRIWNGFTKLWHREYKTLDDRVWGYHSGTVSYQLSQKYPNLIHVEQTSFFRPAYYELNTLFGEGRLHDWRNKNYVIHLWIRLYRGRPIVDDQVSTWNTTLGEVYRYILYGDWRIRNTK